MKKLNRTLTTTLLALGLQVGSNAYAADAQEAFSAEQTASTITTADGVELYYKDWGPKGVPPSPSAMVGR